MTTDWYSAKIQDQNARYIEGKWNGVVTCLKNAANDAPAMCDYKRFLESVEPVRGLSLTDKANFVNAAVNDWITYTADVALPGQDKDVWSPPHETVFTRKGDCEDFAFLKYAVLRALGVPAKNMMLAVVAPKGSHPSHAVLLVNDTPQGFCFPASRQINDAWLANALVMDNSRLVLPARFPQTGYSFYLGISIGAGVLRCPLRPTGANAAYPTGKKPPKAPGY